MGEKIQLYGNTTLETYNNAIKLFKRYVLFGSIIWTTFLIHILDCLITFIAINFYGETENNPLMNYLFLNYDVGFIMVISIILFMLCNYIIEYVFIKYPKCQKTYIYVFMFVMNIRFVIVLDNCLYMYPII